MSEPGNIIPWIGKTAKYMGYYFTDCMKEKGIDLSKEQFLILMYLKEKDGRNQNELAFITNRSKTSLTRLINTIEKKHLVFRVICKADKRINHIHLTAQGREILEKSVPVVRALIQELQAGISTDDLKTTQMVLEQIQTNIQKKSIITN